MKKTIYIHVGAGKTGTSALQRFFFINKDLLAEAGYEFPESGQLEGSQLIQHHALSDHGSFMNPEALLMWKKIALNHESNIIVSSELFHNKISSKPGKEFFENIRDMFSDWDIRVVFYIRRQSQWLQSAYSQHVKGELEGRSFPEYAQKYTRNLPDQINEFAEVFGAQSMIVRPFERGQFIGGDICKDFCHAVGVGWKENFEIPAGNPNPRMSADALEMKRKINLALETKQEARIYQKALLEYSAISFESASTKTFHDHNLADVDAQRRIETDNEKKYSQIARDFLGRSDGVLFHDGFWEKFQELSEAVQKGYEPIDTTDAELFLKSKGLQIPLV